MRKRPLTLFATGALTALATVAALAAVHGSKDDRPLQPFGKPVSCIVSSQITDSQVRDDSTIDFSLRGRVYRNHLPEPCPELGFEKSFIHKSPIDSECSGDIITVFRHDTPGLPGASCALGEFQPMSRAPHPD